VKREDRAVRDDMERDRDEALLYTRGNARNTTERGVLHLTVNSQTDFVGGVLLCTIQHL